MAQRTPAHIVQPAIVLLGALLCAVLGSGTGHSAAAPVTPIAISQVPLTVAVPAHPQVLIAIGNSESMDGSLSGAIMAGSGSLGAGLSLLQNSSSPLNYTIPAGFTPPLSPGNGVVAPYTVASGGHLVDNSPSRLNVAKQGIAAMLKSFMATADFALLDYQLSGTGIHTTWLYQMSPPGGFVFTSTQTPGNRYAPNPCFQYTSVQLTNPTLYSDCVNIDNSGQVTGSLDTSQWMQIDGTVYPTGGQYNGGSSDDPLINDVLYAGSGIHPVCLVYGGPSPKNPYTGGGSFSLNKYNNGNVSETYSGEVNSCARTTTPTNAGFVPYAPQTIYMQRGFGYGGGQSSTNATTLVPMTTAGAVPTTASVNAAVAKFTPHLAPETNSTGTGEIKAAGGQSALPALLAGAYSYYTTANPPSSNGCPCQQYVILLTDGLPTVDLDGTPWPPPGTVSGAPPPTGWGMTPYIDPVTRNAVGFNSDGSLDTANVNDQALLDTISQLQQLNSGQNPIKTYIIGLGAGVDPTVNPIAAKVLRAMAIAGGTNNYFAATDPTTLTNDLQTILRKINAATQSTAATAVNSTGLQKNAVAYLAQFTTSDTNKDWTGNLNAWPIDPNTGQVNTTPGMQNWSAGPLLDGQAWDTGRQIATWDPATKQGTPFRWNPAAAPAGISATTPLGLALSTFPADTNGQDVLQFLRGDNSLEVRNGGQFRNRTHKLGDIVDSAPLYVGAPNGLTQSADYFAFATANQSRPAVIYVGADDGMLHAFDAVTGNERFAYVPNGVFKNLVKLADPYYNQSHLFYVNGSPRAADVKFASCSVNCWHTVLVGTEGAGGSSVFALDVTAPQTLTTEAYVANAVLWEFTDSDMGLTFSEPEIVNTAAGWMVLVGNGYNSPNQKPVLYGLDPQTGAIIKNGTGLAKVDLCAKVPTACNTAVANGLSSVAVVNSYGQVSAPANVVYAGDLQGNVWRVDISDPDPANWIVSVLYQTLDPSGVSQPITTVPAVTLNPNFPKLLGTMVYVGTGALLSISDLSNTQTQTMYGIYDAPTGASAPVGFSGIPTRANLQQQILQQEIVPVPVTATNPTGQEPVRTVYNPVQPLPLPPTAGAVRGWYVDLAVEQASTASPPGAPTGPILDIGERIVTDPEIESGGGLVFTTYQPNASDCIGGGNAWLMVLNFATGANFPQPELDVNGDGKLNSAGDVPGSGNVPVGMSLGAVYASTPTLLPGGGGIGGTNKLTSLSSGTVDSVLDRGRAKQRISWWEVRH